MASLYDLIMKQYHKDRNTEAFYNSQGFSKLWHSFKDFLKTKTFQEFIESLRGTYEIPERGYEILSEPWTIPPKEWKYTRWSSQHRKIKTEIKKFCLDKQLPYKDWDFIIEHYLFFNKVTLSPDPNSHNLCYVTDILTNKDSLGADLTEDLKNAYPVGLLISPYASKRDVIDYINKLYKTEILPFQKKYKKNGAFIGKSRSKIPSIQQRDNFIYDNRDLSYKKIAEKLKKDLNVDVDVGYIGKIISREKKKRQ